MTEAPTEGVFLSIVINNYNYARFIGEAIESALAVADETCEIIVVDDGSTDESVEVIRKFDGITLVEKTNGGQGSALNAGFAAAKGRYIHFLDADDLLVPDALEKIRRTMPGKHMVRFASTVLDQDVGVVSYYASARVKPKPELWSELFGKGGAWLFPMSSNVFSRELLEMVMPIPEPQWRVCADLVMMALASKYARYHGSPETLNHYRLHGENLYFSYNLSLLESHLYEDRYHFKNSTHLRNFFIGGCDTLLTIDNAWRYAAVLGNWVAFGENIRDYGMLTQEHRQDIENSLEQLMASQPVTFWQDAVEALRGANVDPAHVSAFHERPGGELVEKLDEVEKSPRLQFNEWIDCGDFEDYLQGGSVIWHEGSEQLTFSLSQASRFSARVNQLSGFIRATFKIAPDSVAGGMRLVNQDGRIAEIVEIDDLRVADIPCDWVLEGQLVFHFVFEQVHIPHTVGFSTFDPCLSGAYLISARFAAPVASHFYHPMQADETIPAEKLLSPIRHLREAREECCGVDGEVRLSRNATSFAASLPFVEEGQEWLEFEIENKADRPMAIKIVTQFSTDHKYMDVDDMIILPAGRTTVLPIAIGFDLFSDTPPEVTLSCLVEPQRNAPVIVRSIKYSLSDENRLRHLPGDILTFRYGSIAGAALGRGWQTHSTGVAPDEANHGLIDAPNLVVSLPNPVPNVIELTFKPRDEDRSSTAKSEESREIGIGINGAVEVLQLTPEGKCSVRTNGEDQLEISGWWSHDPSKPLVLSRIGTGQVAKEHGSDKP